MGRHTLTAQLTLRLRDLFLFNVQPCSFLLYLSLLHFYASLKEDFRCYSCEQSLLSMSIQKISESDTIESAMA